VTYILRAQWVCDDGTIKRYRRVCRRQPTAQSDINPVTGAMSARLAELDEADDQVVWSRKFARLDWYEFEQISEGDDTP
jgi:hypothetical protein